MSGLLADGFLAGLCPPDRVVSGFCTATWYLRAGDAIILGAALAAVLVVALPALLAPERRLEVAVIAYLLGAAAALSMVGGTFDFQAPLPLAAALGALALLIVRRVLLGHAAPGR